MEPQLELAQETGASKRLLGMTRNPVTGLILALVCMLPFAAFGVFEGMTVVSWIGILLVVWLAVENGGNDVSKGVAPLVTSGAVGELGALIYGSLITAAGSILSIYVSMKLLKLFTAGLIDPKFVVTGGMVLAMAAGASLWVALATRFSWPVSTTHAIVGAVLAVGCIAFGASGVMWSNIGNKVIVPLLFSPVVGLAVSWALSFVIEMLRIPEGAGKATAWVSSGAVCFVRALNDTPKIVGIAVLTAFSTLSDLDETKLFPIFLLITVAMTAGSLIKGYNVLQLLSKKVSKMNNSGSTAAVLATAVLVSLSSKLGWPVSTTHVSTTAIIGSGLRQGKDGVNWGVVREMALSWVITLPAAGVFAAVVYGGYLLFS
ncbi:inorganic phosphate transporter [Tumebacillus sp. ITR2]|uniref:Phosphate transporter n=1 Tax=Tumebacillus amylolyticus TaxID=2801339 RepID=A0ABS1JFS5_9BACL|nr:inorganic phosphate transporter [Tumebacillus amylolyticus]MBL0389140.1 inorganic phosphate transporter [Tumebacillus amylolyticus]